jgi:hypothetical protein
MKIALFETSHPISQTVCRTVADTCGFDLYSYDKHAPNLTRYDAVMGYGILRGMKELYASHPHWFEIDKGLWDANHYDGQYRFSYRGTQPIYGASSPPQADHGQILQPWRDTGYTLICPPTDHVCEFFGIDGWTIFALANEYAECVLRHKGDDKPIEWDKIGKLVTFNSSLGFEALKRGIPVISDPTHSTIGSFQKNAIDPMNRSELFSFCAAHMRKLGDKEGIHWLIDHYLATSAGIAGKPLRQTSYATRFSGAQTPL